MTGPKTRRNMRNLARNSQITGHMAVHFNVMYNTFFFFSMAEINDI